MKLDLAILQLLDSMPRPVPASVVEAQLPEFYAGRFKSADVDAALNRLKVSGDAHGQARRYVGMLWSITPSGKAAIA